MKKISRVIIGVMLMLLAYTAISVEAISAALIKDPYFIKDTTIYYQYENKTNSLGSRQYQKTYGKYVQTPVRSADIDTFQVLNTIFAKDKNHVYMRDYIMINADQESFEVIHKELPYAKDKKQIFYYSTIIKGADLQTFSPIDTHYAKDRHHVYYEGTIIDIADPDSFSVVVSANVGKDKNHVFVEWRLIPEIDAKTVESLEGGSFLKDHSHSYNISDLTTNGAKVFFSDDPEHFQLLTPAYKAEPIRKNYFKDSKTVYSYGYLRTSVSLAQFDAKTFRVLYDDGMFAYVADKNGIYFYVYAGYDAPDFNFVKITGVDVDSFKILPTFPEISYDKNKVFITGIVKTQVSTKTSIEGIVKNIENTGKYMIVNNGSNIYDWYFFSDYAGIYRMMCDHGRPLGENKNCSMKKMSVRETFILNLVKDVFH